MKKDLSAIIRPALIAIAFIGLIISVELCFIYFNANFNLNSGPSFCSINSVIDCDAVSKTAFSRFLGVPLSVWGLVFYSFLLFVVFFRFPKSFIFALVSISVVASLIMAYISSFIIQKICVLCHALYLVNFILFLVCLTSNSIKDLCKNIFADIKTILSDRRCAVSAVVIALAGIIALVLINIYQPFVPQAKAVSAVSTGETESGYKIGEIGNTLGSKKARLVIKEFTDYECPYCAKSNKSMLKLASEFKNIRIDHHDFPLNKECNPLMRRTIHKNACTAIYYAKAAKKQGKFWDLSTLIFENQQDLSEENILKLAKSINLDIEKLKKDAHDPEIKKEIRRDVQRAKAFGIQGTPSYIIGIKKYEGMMPYSEMKKKIQESL